ncbi:MAG: Smr/MutS family protein [Sphingomonadaceae bacterium]|nr:Smr/MutS family protein [Sphingomonadaceae bacterium]
MARRLAPEEAALWARVAAQVRPLPGRVRPVAAPAPRPIREAPPAPPPPPKRTPAANQVPVEAATLDGSWDSAIRRGRVVPDVTIDLHGYTRDRAFDLLTRMIAEAAASGARVLLVITGKGRRSDDERPGGVIRAALRDWLHAPALRPYIAALRPAHPRHGGGGAWYVILRR